MDIKRNDADLMEHIAISIQEVVSASRFPNSTVPAVTINKVRAEMLVMGLASYEKVTNKPLAIKRHWIQSENKQPQFSTRSSSYAKSNFILSLIGDAANELCPAKPLDLENLSITILNAYEHPLMLVWIDGLSYLGVEFITHEDLDLYQKHYLYSRPLVVEKWKHGGRRYLNNDLVVQPDLTNKDEALFFFNIIQGMYETSTGSKADDAVNRLTMAVNDIKDPQISVEVRTETPEVIIDNRDVQRLKTIVHLNIRVYSEDTSGTTIVMKLEFDRKVLEAGASKPWFGLPSTPKQLGAARRITAEQVGVRPVTVNNGAEDFKGDEVMSRMLVPLGESKITFETNNYAVAIACLKQVHGMHTVSKIDEIQIQSIMAIAEELVKEAQFADMRFGIGEGGTQGIGLALFTNEHKKYLFNF